jgi:hypothetical protein
MSVGKGGIDMGIGGLTVRGRVAEAFDLAATLHGRKLRGELHQSQHERMAEVLDTLTPEDEQTLSQAMCAALPVLEHLSRGTVPDRHAGQAVTALTG